MPKVRGKVLGSLVDDFSVSFDEDLGGDEFKGIFKQGIGSVIYRISLIVNNVTTDTTVRVVVRNYDGDEYILFEDKTTIIGGDNPVAYFSWFDKFLFLGSNEYLGIITDGATGGMITLVGVLAHP